MFRNSSIGDGTCTTSSDFGSIPPDEPIPEAIIADTTEQVFDDPQANDDIATGEIQSSGSSELISFSFFKFSVRQ